ncbi:AMP-binding protein [Desulfitobacterium metallireducens]|uniref:Coenzyme F390 synthetase n=1 Tax=Desulfitobacterium metallireducens DSM 15288 TaxID=871968 RepID=W0E5L0_9FIRM|nr:AMP-binding protein [Desulfitobacterium metallireducens]AHF06150.1 coenzyme F390 synthetase [Desulfitobacterium metallireducens DSM 15288]
MRVDSEKMVEDIFDYIEKFKNKASNSPEISDDFNALALKLFQFQYQWNPVYRKYCQLRRKLPLTVKRWQDIPPISYQMFKESTLACEPIDETIPVFMTSGSTNPEKKGRNYHPTFKVWDASMIFPFKNYVLPDREKMRILVLSPGDDVNQNSSLSRYLSRAFKELGSEGSQLFFHQDIGFDMPTLVAALKQSVAEQEPVLLLGATFAYVHFIDYCQEQGEKFQLPKGSRVFDTGGLKGQAREVMTDELYEWFKAFFDVPRELCINMYGMTELCSQMYDRTIETYLSGGQVIYDKIGPAWTQIQVLDPDTLEAVPDGEIGLLAHYDLANWNSCLAVLTEDMGYKTPDGFVLLGRSKGAEPRGCSIAVDQLIAEQRK